VLGGASDRVFGGLSKAIDVLAPKLEGLAKPFDRLGGAIGGAIESESRAAVQRAVAVSAQEVR
jgi:hypothetical protein